MDSSSLEEKEDEEEEIHDVSHDSEKEPESQPPQVNDVNVAVRVQRISSDLDQLMRDNNIKSIRDNTGKVILPKEQSDSDK